MTIFLSVIHYIVCLILIVVILLQAGRGQGLSGFGGDGTQSLFGTKTSSFMTKMTTIAAIGFIVTCLALDMTTSLKSKSLMVDSKLKDLIAQSVAEGKLPKGVSVKEGAVAEEGISEVTQAAAVSAVEETNASDVGEEPQTP